MTHSPGSEQEPDMRPSRPRRRIWRRVALGIGIVTLVGGAIGIRQALIFIYEDLAPLVEHNLSQTLNRPLALGRVVSFSLSSLELATSTLPPTPTDRDQATVEAVQVRFNLIELLTTRTLRLTINLVKPTLFLDQEKDGAWIKTRLQTQESEGPIKTELDLIRFQDASVVLEPAPQLTTASGEPPGFEDPAQRYRVTVQRLNGTANFYDQNTRIAFDATGVPTTGGDFRVRGEAQTETQAVNLVVQARDFSAQDFSSLVPLPLGLQTGRLAANLEVRIRQEEPLAFNGTARFRDVTATIAGVPNRFSRATGQLRFQNQLITLDAVRALYGQIPARASGTLHTQNGYNLVAQVRSLEVANLFRTFDLKLPIPISGRLNADLRLTGALNQPLVTGTASNTGLVRVDRVNLSTVRTNFSLTPQALSFDPIRVTPAAGGEVVGSGRLAFGDRGGLAFQFQGRNLPGDAIARPYGAASPNFRIGRVGADVQVSGPVDNFRAIVRWRAPEATYAGQGNLIIAGNTLRLEDTTLQVAGGTVTARAEASQGRWQAFVNLANVRLQQFSQELRGLFNGNLRLSGSLTALNPAGVRAEGLVRFSEGLALLNRPLEASILWNGDRLILRQATAPGFRANGFILANLQGAGAPAVTGLNLTVNLQDYDITTLPVTLPPQAQVRGRADFAGQITGTPTAPSVAGRLQLNRLAVNELVFDPVMRGTIQYAGGQGLNLNLNGQNDRIAVQLDGNNRPRSFLIQQDETLAQGSSRGDRLLATVQNFPLSVLNLTPAANFGLGRGSGLVNGSFEANLANFTNPSVVGEVAIARPALGYISADSFTARFRYADGVGVLTASELRLAESLYRLSGSVQTGANPQVQGQILAEPGKVEDILTALQWFDLQDVSRGIGTPTYGSGSLVGAVSIITFGDTLLNQLRRYSEIVALLEEQQTARSAASSLPDLEKLRGPFSGAIRFSGSPQAGLTANFSLEGQNWSWDTLGIQQVVVEGGLDDGVLTLLPFRFQGITYAGIQRQEAAFLTFSGQIGGTQQSGQLRAENIPVEALRDLFRIPIDLAGDINATATLAGSQRNPQAFGEITLTEATLNDTEVQGARAIFGFNDARLNFDGRMVLDQPEPLLISGSVPAKFDFMDPNLNPGEQINLEVNIRNEGLALLNLLSREQLAWKGGEGLVRLQVTGTLSEPQATGIASFTNAQFTAQALPDPLTDVTGTILFNRDRIQVETLRGQFSNGQITAQGVLPIFDPFNLPANPDGDNPMSDADSATQPLTIFLEKLAFNLKGLYNGGVNGQVTITGTALAPRIGGEILLSDGRVLLPTGGAQAPPTTPLPDDGNGFATDPPQFSNLRLTLGDNLLVTSEPLLSFVAQGDLVINGSLGNLRPAGTINLRSGQVNLFTTQFSLARGYDSRAIFQPERGLDPVIDVQLTTSVIEVTRAPSPFQTASPYSASEVADTPITDFGSFQTVRVQASVQGPASQLFENLELSSSPRRSDSEIISLLGGGFVNTLGQGDGTLAIANLAGSALLSNVQNFISNALGLSEFRLFPTTITDQDERTSSFGVAAELGVNITNDFSISALQVLTDQVPTQFNLRYRLNQEFLIRASTNLSGENRAVLEFETRF